MSGDHIARPLGRGRSGLGAYYRAHQARLGKASAIGATAHKLARIIYHMLKDRRPYQPLTGDAYEQASRQREVKSLEQRAAKLGLHLQPQPTAG